MALNGEDVDHIEVDHTNGNGLDNSLENLRIVSKSVNCKNKPIRCDNTTGVTGVSLTYFKGIPTFISQCVVNGKIKRKSFSTKKYGYDEAFQLATDYRNNLVLEDGEYTIRHGVDKSPYL